MAIWEVRVVYRTGERFWENVWHVDVGALTDVPAALLTSFEDFARATLLDAFIVERIVRRPAGTSDEFIETAIGLAGLIATGGDAVLPLFNTVRVLLTSGAGRPGQKFLRGLLTNLDVTGANYIIDPATVTIVQSAMIDLLNSVSDEECYLPEGRLDTAVVSAVVQNVVPMRQQHRKRRRTA